MSAQAPERNVFVDDIVTALTGPVDATGNATTALKDQMRRAADEFDQRTAEAFARALLESLTAETVDLRRLEALLILGLAHPAILQSHAISLRAEGERLATMLEVDGQTDRARCLIEILDQRIGREEAAAAAEEATPLSPEVEAEIEKFMKRADNAAAMGRNKDAIRWLEQIVTLDRSRRDVSRMIGDLRWSDKERKRIFAGRVKLVIGLLVLGGLVWGGFARESYIGDAYKSLPAASGKVASMRERLASIDDLVDTHKLWAGMAPVMREQSRLRREIAAIESAEADVTHKATMERARRIEDAEAARLRGMLLAQQGHFEEALADLRQALELADPKWSEREQVQANIAAIEAWMKKSR